MLGKDQGKVNTGDLRRTVAAAMSSTGLEVVGRIPRVESDEPLWIVELDRVPGQARLGVGVGCWPKLVRGEEMPTSTSFCPVYIALENLRIACDPVAGLARFPEYGSQVVATLDPAATLSDQDRADSVERVIATLATFIRANPTLNASRAALAAGVLVGGFVHRRTEELLSEAGPGGNGS